MLRVKSSENYVPHHDSPTLLQQGQPLSLEGETQFGVAAGGGDGVLVGHGGQRQLRSGQYNDNYGRYSTEAPFNSDGGGTDSYGFRSLDIRNLGNNGGGGDGSNPNPNQAWIVYPKGAGGGGGDNGRPFTAKPLSLGGQCAYFDIPD